MAFSIIGVWTVSEAFDEILEVYGSEGGSATGIDELFSEVINELGFDGF